MKGVIVWGPQGCGKTINAKFIKNHFGLSHVVDDYESGEVLDDTLYLTNYKCEGALEFNEVMRTILPIMGTELILDNAVILTINRIHKKTLILNSMVILCHTSRQSVDVSINAEQTEQLIANLQQHLASIKTLHSLAEETPAVPA